MTGVLTFDTDTLTVRPWADDIVDRLGVDPRSDYVERFWLPILGPSTTWLLRRVARDLEGDPDGYQMDVADTAVALGLAGRPGRNSPIRRTIARTVQFGMAVVTGPAELAVRRRLPPLTRRHIDRLPVPIADEHHAWQAAELARHEHALTGAQR